MPHSRLPPARLARTVLVGRAAELAELVRTVRSSPAVALVEGEAGVGKTRLVREVVQHASVQGRAVLFGSCQPMRTPFPYGPVVDILRDAGTLLGSIAERLPPIVGALRPLFPELAPLLPPEPAKGDVAVERHQVFRAARELIASFGPVLLIVEDLHWADEGTLDLLRFLTSPPTEDLAVILTYRREADNGAALPGAGYRLLSDERNSLLRLRPLEPAQVGAMAAGLLGIESVHEDFAAELHHRTAGIPFVIEELLREVDATAATPLRPRVLDLVDIPILLRDTMAERLARLGPSVTAAVHAAAVLDAPATEDDIAAVAGLPPRRIVAALTRALAAAVLHEAGPERYALRHPLASQAVHASIPGPQRYRMHARAAELLAAQPEPPVVRLAHHYRQAGDVANWVRRTVAAIDHATSVGDTALAIEMLESALTDDQLPGRARNILAVRLSRVALNGIANSGTVERLRSVLRDETLGKESRGEVRLNLGQLLTNQVGHIEAGQNEIEMALHDLRERPALAARGLAALSMASFGTRPIGAHLTWLREAEDTLRSLESAAPQEELSAAVQTNRLTLLAQIGDPSAWEIAAGLPPATRSPKIRSQLARAYANMADAAAWLGHHKRARQYLRCGTTLLADTDVPFLSMLATGTALRLDAATGRFDTLESDAAQLIDQAGDMLSLASEACLALAWLSYARGDRDRASRHFSDALAAAPEISPLAAAVAAGQVAIALAKGDVGAATVGAHRALDAVRRKDNWVWAAELAPHATRALLRGGRAQDASAVIDEFERGVIGRDAPMAMAAVELSRGLLAHADGDNAEALVRFTQAGKGYDDLPQPFAAAEAHELAARSALNVGDTASAAALLVVAATEFTALGATRAATRCSRLARRFCGGPQRGRRSYGDDLSPRESEVVAFARVGMTNRQIAEELFLSPRTVEHHVASAMRKLGLASRAAFREVN